MVLSKKWLNLDLTRSRVSKHKYLFTSRLAVWYTLPNDILYRINNLQPVIEHRIQGEILSLGNINIGNLEKTGG